MRKSRTLEWIYGKRGLDYIVGRSSFLAQVAGRPSDQELVHDLDWRPLCPSERMLAAAPVAVSSGTVAEHFEQMPLAFEPTTGQPASQAKFMARGIGYALFLAPTEAVLKLRESGRASGVLRLQLVGANPSSEWSGSDQLAGKSNYLIGSSPANWRTDIPNYGKVTERAIYRGIDVVYYGNQHALEYDFVVAPGAKPDAIQLAFQGSTNLRVEQGNLVSDPSEAARVRTHQPVAYQESHGVR